MVFKYYGLSIVLSVLFFLAWVGQGVFQYYNQPTEASQFIPEYLQSTFEDRQSELLQLSALALLSTLVKVDRKKS